MPELTSRTSRRQIEQDLGLDDLHGEILFWVIIGCWGGALGLLAYLSMFSLVPIRQNWIAASALLTLGIIAWSVAKRSPRASAVVLTVGLLLVAGATPVLYPNTATICALSIVVIVASIAIGPRFSLATAVVATIIVAVAALPERGLVAGDVALVAVCLIWANAVLAFLGSRPLHAALHWAWDSLDHAQGTIEELRDSRGKLAQASKSLNEAYMRLERLNAELDRARRVAEEARRQKAEFATAVSHELRTPLNLIIGFSEMMIRHSDSMYGERLPDAYQDDVQVIYRNAAHISHLVDDILDLSQIEAHRMGLRKERASLAEIVDEVFATIGSLFRDKGLYLRASLPPDLPSVQVDPTRVRQVLLNLLSNAVRFTDDGGISITIEHRGPDILVTTRDSGVGIAPESLPLVFMEFRQFSGAGGAFKGTGLGLAVSKRLIELHGGNMWVESALGDGSAFYFTLPLNDTVVASPFDSGPSLWERIRSVSNEERILAVLDETRGGEATRILERYLDRFSIVRVRNLGEVGRAAESGKLCALLVAEASSSALARARSEFPNLPVVACSFEGIESPEHGLGARAYLVKPVSRDQMKTALRQLGVRVRRILVVDDDPEMVRLLTEMIQSFRRSCVVWGARGGVEGLKVLREAAPDAVVLDLLMPEVDGRAFVETMRQDERFRETPIIIVTARGYDEKTIRVGALEVSRGCGLTVGEAVRCLGTSLDALAPS